MQRNCFAGLTTVDDSEVSYLRFPGRECLVAAWTSNGEGVAPI